MKTLKLKSIIFSLLIAHLIIIGCQHNTTSNSLEVNSNILWDIYILDIESGVKTNLTKSEAYDVYPSISKDNSRIVFGSTLGASSNEFYQENLDLYVMNSDGKDLHRLTLNMSASYAKLSPDGLKVAFLTYKDKRFLIYLIDINGQNQKLISNNSFDSYEPVWSANSDKLYFIQNKQIHVINADGSQLKALTNDSWNHYFLALSPDGSKIAFLSDRDGQSAHIYSINVDGTNEQRLITAAASNIGPISWSPDGSKFAFTHDSEVYTMNSEGTNKKQLTNTVGNGSPLWSPNGDKILFIYSGNSGYEIYIMDKNGENQERITNNYYKQEYSISWSTDGTKVLYGLGEFLN